MKSCCSIAAKFLEGGWVWQRECWLVQLAMRPTLNVTQHSQLQLVETQLLLLELKREFIESHNWKVQGYIWFQVSWIYLVHIQYRLKCFSFFPFLGSVFFGIRFILRHRSPDEVVWWLLVGPSLYSSTLASLIENEFEDAL